ncbi:glutamate racemase [Candidatus Uhrbacteria bacterium RIFCSPHIGHO2_12_FULL_57_11]|uniref:Glutamate racemase n=1 Tax=Candidatus Uhrbacteria bacterium RIFCSPHIGHO2_12_FULL_57_11 TaxID=1802398 RepID=A0A1F7UKU4_9BACT|nr:MAG: glutamate racemase [Candidatus Uhrbacteria bacterium RIFCSPHIGHO2_12_FULL_57_11]
MNSPRLLEGSVGFFDSGVGGLTILSAVLERVPDLSTAYLGDNARLPYGNLEEEEIFGNTVRGVRWLLDAGCPLVVVACNTASAQALRRIQREILPREFSSRRVLGVIRPSAEELVGQSKRGHIGIVGTTATVRSGAYTRECRNLRPDVVVTEVAAPALVPQIERGITTGPEIEETVRGAVGELIRRDSDIDTVLLACTHFPLVADTFSKTLPYNVRMVIQGPIVAASLQQYLLRHPEIDSLISRTARRTYNSLS